MWRPGPSAGRPWQPHGVSRLASSEGETVAKSAKDGWKGEGRKEGRRGEEKDGERVVGESGGEKVVGWGRAVVGCFTRVRVLDGCV